ncbi:MAG: hypothetical protein IPN22_02255 [Bacteroidetes bacterium]|nr:hypothetical protein [Bacteroidota bacterium]
MATDIVFELVKSLDRSEKGYFKKFAQRYGDKDGGSSYLLLFDILDKADNYNEQKIKTALQKKYSQANLSALKKYLKEQLMKALRSYHSAGTVRIQLMEMMKDMEVLYSKGLFDQMEETYQEAKKLCMAHNIALTQLQLNYYWQVLLIRNFNPSQSDTLEPFREEQEKLMKEYGLNLEISRMESKVAQLLFRFRNTDGAEIANQTTDFLKHPLFSNIAQYTPRQQSVVYNVLHQYHSICNQHELALSALKMRIAIIEKMHENPLRSGQDYIITLFNMLVESKRGTSEYDTYFNKLKNLQPLNEHQELYKREIIFRLYLNELSEKPVLKEVQEAEQAYLAKPLPTKYDTRISNAQSFAYCFYQLGDFDKALDWCNKEFQEDEYRYDSSAVNNALLKTIIYIEQEKPTLAASTAQSAIYFIKRYLQENTHLIKVFQLLQHIAESNSPSNQKKHTRDLIAILPDTYLTSKVNLMEWCKKRLGSQ